MLRLDWMCKTPLNVTICQSHTATFLVSHHKRCKHALNVLGYLMHTHTKNVRYKQDIKSTEQDNSQTNILVYFAILNLLNKSPEK